MLCVKKPTLCFSFRRKGVRFSLTVSKYGRGLEFLEGELHFAAEVSHALSQRAAFLRREVSAFVPADKGILFHYRSLTLKYDAVSCSRCVSVCHKSRLFCLYVRIRQKHLPDQRFAKHEMHPF